jgi:hypothetical protein
LPAVPDSARLTAIRAGCAFASVAGLLLRATDCGAATGVFAVGDACATARLGLTAEFVV